MHDPDNVELRSRLELLAPSIEDLGNRTLETYAAAGILAAFPDAAFPVSDARFRRTAEGMTYHPHGPVYFSISRSGQLELGTGTGIPFTDAVTGYVQLAREQDVEDAGPPEAPADGFPPPRLILDADTSRLYIADVSPAHHGGFVPLERYIDERAQLFTAAFRAAN